MISERTKVNLFAEHFTRQPHKMVKHSQNNSQRIVWVCSIILWG